MTSWLVESSSSYPVVRHELHSRNRFDHSKPDGARIWLPMHLKLGFAAAFTAGLIAAQPFPAEQWQRASPAEASLDHQLLAKARDYALSGEGSGLVIRNGKAVFHWGDQKKLYDLKSSSKSIAGAALGLALADGKLTLNTAVSECLPELKTRNSRKRETRALAKSDHRISSGHANRRIR